MAKDPAFLFYPGDYLRDTQNFSTATQVAYDRIMCEHMRNICITQQQVKFFMKRLSEDEKEELMLSLTKVKGGFQIEWVAESIVKRRAYSKSRRENREGNPKDISETYDQHMEDVIEIEYIEENGKGIVKGKFSPPSLQDIKDFLKDQYKDTSEADKIFNFYTSNGWKVGKNPMKDWRASARNWIARNKESGPEQSPQDYQAEKQGGLKIPTQ